MFTDPSCKGRLLFSLELRVWESHVVFGVCSLMGKSTEVDFRPWGFKVL